MILSIGYFYHHSKGLPRWLSGQRIFLQRRTLRQMRVWSPGREDPLEEGMATHSSILAREIPWTEEPGGLQSRGSQRIRHDWSGWACLLKGGNWELLLLHNLAMILLPVGGSIEPYIRTPQSYTYVCHTLKTYTHKHVYLSIYLYLLICRSIYLVFS